MTSESNSNSTYSNSITNNNNNNLTDPFSTNSYQNRSYGNSLSNYELNSQNASESTKTPQDDEIFVLSDSKFTLTLNYQKGQKEANVVYKDITYKNKKGENFKTNIDIVKKYEPDNNKIKKSYQKFINNFLDKVENEFKADYRKEKEIEIIMEITGKYPINDSDYLRCDCKFTINDGRDKNNEENEFTEEDFLNKYVGDGLGCLINDINNED